MQIMTVSRPGWSASALLRLMLAIGLSMFGRCGLALEKPPENNADFIAAAARAFADYDLSASQRYYESVIASTDASAEQLVTARRALALYASKFRRDRVAASWHLEQAKLSAKTELSQIYLQRAGIELDAGNVLDAIANANRALSAAATPSEEDEAFILLARCALQNGGNRPSHSAEALRGLRDALAGLDRVLERQPGRSDAAATLLEVGLQLNDGPAVLRAFMAYYLFADEAAVTATMRQPYLTLRRLAGTWHEKPLPRARKRALVTALMQSRFYHSAAEVAGTLHPHEPAFRPLLHYDAFLQAVLEVNETFYPRIALGLRNYQDDYDSALEVPARRLLLALGQPPRAERRALFDQLFATIRSRFAAEGYLGTTMNFYGMLAGHGVLDEQQTVTQYGYAGAFRYLAIDQMISRDFTSWYGTTNVGGWGTETSMVQVRQAYLKEPYRRLAWVLDPVERAKLRSRIATLEKSDLERCTADRYAEPAALPLQLKLDASDRLYARLRDRGLTGQSLALAFISETMHRTVETTVFAHEGRHALDQLHFKAAFDLMGDDERELRAKYSEIVFTAEPKLALTGSVLGGQLDESSGHGRANKRFRVMLVDWMNAHADQIAGLDRNRPLIMQAGLLSDAQLIEMVKASDSMRPATAPGAAPQATAAASAVLELALAAQGGERQLRALRSVQWQAKGYRNMIEQSERPQGPYMTEFNTIKEIHDYHGQRFLRKVDVTILPYPSRSVGIALDKSIAMRLNGKTKSAGTPQLAQLARERLALSPERLLLTAFDAADCRAEPDAVLQGVPQNVLAFSMDGAPIRIYLNAYTHLPTAVDYSGPLARSGFASFLGDATLRVYYNAWGMTRSGIRYPLQWNSESNGLPDAMMHIYSLAFNEVINDDDLTVTDEVRAAYRPQPVQNDHDATPLGLPGQPAYELAPGLVLIPGAWNVAIVRQEDGIVILEAPISSAYTVKVLAEAERRFPGLPVKAVITTSDAWPHLAGIRQYVAESIPVYALDLNRAILERVVDAPYTSRPDTQQDARRQLNLQMVNGKTNVGTGANRIEIYPLRGETSERQMMVYFPHHHLLYGSDVFQQGEAGGFYRIQAMAELSDAVLRHKLAVDDFFMMHMGRTRWSEVLNGIGMPSAEQGDRI